MKVSTVAEMRAMDSAAIERFGIAEELLMENAGLAAVRVLADRVDIHAGQTVIVCGGGNNGGDGLVVARHIHSAGGDVHVLLISDPSRYKGAARTNFDIVRGLEIEVVRVTAPEDAEEALGGAMIIVDALLGTGIERPVAGLYADVIALVNSSNAAVLSIDVPSGVNGDTGQVLGNAVRADWTVSFGLPKVGNVLLPGHELGGELTVSHISFPPALYEADQIAMALNVPPALPPRPIDGHKGTFGQALFIAGAATYFGAPTLSALSYLKSGGGYSRLAAPAGIIPTIAAQGAEIVFVPQRETAAGSIAADNLDDLLALIDRMDFVVIGPGLSLDAETQQLVRAVASRADKPLLIDGDGISAILTDLDCVRGRTAPTVLTPHLGEMSRLTGQTVDEIVADRVAALRALCSDLKATVVMKGAHTLVGQPDGRIWVNLTGNSAMATAGSGDVLTGAIAAMAGLGLTFGDAVRTGVFVHGLAGDLAAADIGADGVTAADLMAYMPRAVHALRTGVDSPDLAYALGPTVVPIGRQGSGGARHES